jgi:hypothetical protein
MPIGRLPQRHLTFLQSFVTHGYFIRMLFCLLACLVEPFVRIQMNERHTFTHSELRDGMDTDRSRARRRILLFRWILFRAHALEKEKPTR